MHKARSNWTMVGVVMAALSCLLGVVYGVQQANYQADYDARLKRLGLFTLRSRMLTPPKPPEPSRRGKLACVRIYDHK
jgi:hypothetical protein